MKIKSSMHNHSTWCDGKNSVEEMIEAAIRAGFTDFGFSSHSHDPKFPESLQDENGYILDVRNNAKKYKDKIRIYCGIEQDYLSKAPEKGLYDYIIGSVHYVPLQKDITYCVDESPDVLENALSNYYEGDWISMVKDYYNAVVDNVQNLKPDIIGHFDLLLKFNSNNKYFDENSKIYRDISLSAIDACMQISGVVEINTGGQFRGYRDFPYPQNHILEYLAKYNYPVMINMDCHNAEGIDFGMKSATDLLKKTGFKKLTQYYKGEFINFAL